MAPLTVSSWQPPLPPLCCGVSSLLRRATRPASRRCVNPLRRLRLRPTGCPIRRLDIFTSKCFATNIDVDCDNVVAKDPIAGSPTPLSSSCSIPTVHLNSDCLDSNHLDLSGKETDANHLLTKLHVLSKGEQDALAATPTHRAGLHALYAISLVGNLVEQLWSFVWPAAVAIVHPNLLPVAVVGFFTKLTIFLGGPVAGKLMDYFPRVRAYHNLNLVQTAAQLLSAGMIIFALNTTKQSSSSSVLLQPWFIVLVMAGALERLAGLALGVTMERDWVVLLAGRNRPVALAQANSILSRIDLVCEIAGASLFGILLSKYNPVTCLKLACGLTMCVQPVLFILGHVINSLSNGVLDRSRFTPIKPVGTPSLFDAQKLVENGLDAFRHGWKEYKHQPVLPASLAYVLLYFNIALAPGAIMTSLLVHHGINPSIIGGFSGLCSIMGFAATFMSASLVKKFGILKAGAAGLMFQAFLLTLAVSVYWTGSITQQSRLLFFLSLIVVSRMGHMSYDVVGTQILQTGIPPSKANLIGITEVSMASLAELLMFGVAIIANDVAHFGFLATLSLSSVVVAALIFSLWMANPTESQRKHFKFDTPL
ncbi:solute carrier family 40 member 2, chloroplastic [Canna indica]|uniref:Solute carrier family 40 member n=1 Tax=Canna indica TaxID=4628 RepID=A0AAQ3K8X9_9LILI|nr:solute carrier family 40 member 2, chloroplastic [Canna indica]